MDPKADGRRVELMRCPSVAVRLRHHRMARAPEVKCTWMQFNLQAASISFRSSSSPHDFSISSINYYYPGPYIVVFISENNDEISHTINTTASEIMRASDKDSHGPAKKGTKLSFVLPNSPLPSPPKKLHE